MTQLEAGIYFEDTDELLPWGSAISDLIKHIECNITEGGDRTTYYWGKRTILKGLTLPLENMFWRGDKREFNSIQFKTVGDKYSKEYFETIHAHLTNLLGEPSKVDIENEPEGIWTWEQGNVEISLDLFEQHAYKLFLTIRKK